MERVGQKLIDEKRAAILAGSTGSMDKVSMTGRDILSVMSECGWWRRETCTLILEPFSTVKANMATDVKEDEQMTDEEVIDRW